MTGLSAAIGTDGGSRPKVCWKRRHGYSFTVTAEARVGAMTDSLTGPLTGKSLPTSIEIWSAPTEFV